MDRAILKAVTVGLAVGHEFIPQRAPRQIPESESGPGPAVFLGQGFRVFRPSRLRRIQAQLGQQHSHQSVVTFLQPNPSDGPGRDFLVPGEDETHMPRAAVRECVQLRHKTPGKPLVQTVVFRNTAVQKTDAFHGVEDLQWMPNQMKHRAADGLKVRGGQPGAVGLQTGGIKNAHHREAILMTAGEAQLREGPGQRGGAATSRSGDHQAQGQQLPGGGGTGCTWNRQSRLHKSA